MLILDFTVAFCCSLGISSCCQKPWKLAKQMHQEIALSIWLATQILRAFSMLCKKVAHLLLHILRASHAMGVDRQYYGATVFGGKVFSAACQAHM
jgi:hypothetical protein